MTRIIVANRCNDRENLGDTMAGPDNYFTGLQPAERIDIWQNNIGEHIRVRENAVVIVGGGGLLAYGNGPAPEDAARTTTFDTNLRRLSRLGLPGLVLWGAGHQGRNLRHLSYPKALERFDLVGIRDWLADDRAASRPPGYQWVPCPSALHTAFDTAPRVKTREVVIFEHAKHRVPFADPAIRRMDNTETDIHRVIGHLASADLAVTTSFHGAYWATLAGCRVLVIQPFATKFLTMKHSPQLTFEPHRWLEAARRAVTWPWALEECRQRNLEYAAQVQEFIGNVLLRRQRAHRTRSILPA
ncbi:MAG TPA: hypothetical protein VMK13_12400 [Streptosporangiaceae bacterium]|nr:hypothetical protein [Streptosporangiaceae bacterium]